MRLTNLSAFALLLLSPSPRTRMTNRATHDFDPRERLESLRNDVAQASSLYGQRASGPLRHRSAGRMPAERHSQDGCATSPPDLLDALLGRR